MKSEITPLQLNNLIVDCRKIVKQAKVHCVRRIVNQMKLLENRNGTQEQMEKNRRKVQRLRSELSAMKKINNDDVTKFALVNTASFAELMQKTPVADKAALYKLTFCDVLVNKIDEIREKYQHWPVEIPFILQRLGLQYKLKKSKTDDRAAKTKYCKKLAQRQVNKDFLVPKKNREKRDADLDTRRKEKTSQPMECSKTVKETERTLPFRPSDKNSPQNVKLKEGRFGVMEVRRFKLDAVFDHETLPSVSHEETGNFEDGACKPIENSLKSLKNDAFFATEADGSSLVMSVVKEEDNVEPDLSTNDATPEDTCKKKSRKSLSGKFSSSMKHQERSEEAQKPPKSALYSSYGKASRKNISNSNLVPLGKTSLRKASATGENRKQRRLKLRQQAQEAADLADLHPSWRAKKMQKQPLLLPPAGKRIKFTDDCDNDA